MKTWQHDETGRTTVAPECPGPRWAEVPEPPIDYAHRIRCPACDGWGTLGELSCTDCLGKGLDPMAMNGGIEAALNDAYAEGRKDEREAIMEQIRRARETLQAAIQGLE